MKQYTILKFGYTSGMYGCSGEYFTLIMINGSKQKQYWFEGMYGADERVRSAMNKKGWKQFHTHTPYGKLTKSDLYNKHFILNEYEMVEVIKDNFKSDCVAGCPRSKQKGKETCGEKQCNDFVKKYLTD